jgi:hypothetical protein
MKTPLTLLLSLTFLFLFGCSANGKWVKADSTERDWSKDFSDCQSKGAGGGLDMFQRGAVYHHCMIGKGWDFVDEQGKKISCCSISRSH